MRIDNMRMHMRIAKIDLMLATNSVREYDVPCTNATRLDIIHRIMEGKS